jgi:flagellar biosynthesis/type III secretory pathway protein FliH
MSGLLKSGSASLRDRVRPLVATLPHGAPASDPERERLAGEVEALGVELAARGEAIASLKEEVARAYEAGKAEGRETGLEEAEDRGAELLAAIESAAAQGLARFEIQLGEMERLALLLAQTCLDRMLLASEERLRIVGDLVRGQVAALGEGAAIRIQVSARDFASPDALAQLAPACGSGGCEIVASEALASGDCTIALQLGTLDIGLNQQWGAIRTELEAMIEAGRGG